MSTDRRKFEWHQIRRPIDAVASVIATAGGAGLLPIAPGTWGTLVAIPLAWATTTLPIEARILFWSILFVIGVWSAKHLDELMQTQDNQCVVIDEVVGLGVTAWLIPQGSWIGWTLAFLVFRLFDIWKPFPIRWIDQWSHRQSTFRPAHEAYWWSGFGVMADDLLAGFYGLAVCAVWVHFWGVQ